MIDYCHAGGAPLDAGMIVFDLDDTLLRDDRTVSDETVQVMREAARRGIHIVPASGRAQASMQGVVERLGCVSCYISCNGGEIYAADHQPLQKVAFSTQEALDIAAFLEQEDCYFQVYAGDKFFYNKECGYAESYAQATLLSGQCVGKLTDFIHQPTAKVLAMDEPERIAKLLEKSRKVFAGRASVTCSKPYFLEFNPPEATKGNALVWCARHLDVDISRTIAFGDSLNDVSMLSAAGRGVAMKNAREDVLAMDFAVTHLTNDQDGVADYITKHILT